MDEQMAGLVVIALTAVGAVVWLAAVATLMRAGRERRTSAAETYEPYEIEATHGAETIVGSADVAGAPEELSAKLASALARGGLGRLGPVKVIAQDRREVLFESAGVRNRHQFAGNGCAPRTRAVRGFRRGAASSTRSKATRPACCWFSAGALSAWASSHLLQCPQSNSSMSCRIPIRRSVPRPYKRSRCATSSGRHSSSHSSHANQAGSSEPRWTRSFTICHTPSANCSNLGERAIRTR